MASDADLNAHAAAAYDGMALHVTDPEVDAGVTVADGGTKVSITMGTPGVAGPDSARHPATVGRTYSSEATFTLAEAAYYVSVWDGTTYMRRARLRSPIGPGTFPVVYALTAR